MNKRPLVPSFLQRLDDTLLRNKPNTWAARTHLVIWFAALFALALTAFCYLAFFDAKQYSSTGSWITFVCLIAFIGFVFWLIFLFRFNVFKRYGNWYMWDGLKNFGLYFASIGAMVALCFIPSAVETYRANQQFGNDEIVNDINEINTTACKLEYNLLPLQWTADTFNIIKRAVSVQTYSEEEMVTVDTVITIVVEEASVQPVQNYIRKHSVMDTGELRKRIAETDSLIKINDSLYVFYKCPDYQFVASYNADNHADKKILGSPDIYYSTIKNYQKPNNRQALLKIMEAFKIKYAVDNRYSYYEEIEEYNGNYDKKIRQKYSLTKIGNGIDNAVRKKYAWADGWDVYARFFYYTTLLLTLLVFIFRHSTVKTFFLSVLTAVLLMIITALLMVAGNGEESAVFSFMIVYYFIFAGIALSIFGAAKRNVVQGISLNLFLFATPFIPVIFVALNEAVKRSQHYANPVYKATVQNNSSLYFLIAEIAGSILLLILLEPLFRKLYRKWYAAPEN